MLTFKLNNEPTNIQQTICYSRKIVGYYLSDNLELKGCVRALNKAVY